MSNDTKKAERTTVWIDDIEISAYLLPPRETRLAGRNITDAIGESNNTLTRIMGVKSLKDLPGADSSLGQIRAETGESFIPVSVDDAIHYWALMTSRGNQKALALITALASESLETRVDKALGIKRSDEERDQRLKLRMRRVSNFFKWTDCIKTSQEHRGIYGTEAGKLEFAKLIAKVNKALFGQPNFNYDRDTMTFDQQNEIATFEQLLRKKFNPTCNMEKFIEDLLDFYAG